MPIQTTELDRFPRNRWRSPSGEELFQERDEQGRLVLRGGNPAKHALVADGDQLFQRIGRLFEEGALDAEHIPLCTSLMPADPLADFTPWRFGRFGGGAQDFFESAVAPSISPDAPTIFIGYSLAGLFGLWCACTHDAFSHYVLISPSVWFHRFPEFAIAHEPLDRPETVLWAHGEGEGKGKPEPLAHVFESAQAIAAHHRICLMVDGLDHHAGLMPRLQRTLALL